MNSRFGNVLAPTNIQGGNNQIAMNDPFSRVYVNDASQTWGMIHDASSNLSGFPWYKGQVPTLAIKPSFGAKRKRKSTTKKRKRNGSKGSKTAKNWVQKAIKRPGSLTAYAKRVAPRKAFTKRETLRVSWLREVVKKDKSEMRRRQAQLALRLKKMLKRKSTKKRKKVKRKVKRKTTKRKRKTIKRKVTKKRKVKRKVTKKSKFGGKFNYTIQQYGNDAGTPNLNQMHKISGLAAYDFPVAGPSVGGMNLRWFDSKSNQAGMGIF